MLSTTYQADACRRQMHLLRLVLSLVESTPAVIAKPKSRCQSSWDKANHMRLTGVINKGRTAGPDVAPHVQAKLDATNSLAKRHVDKIDLAQRKPANIRGKGAYKQWTTEACLRTAWGRPLDLARKDTGGMSRGAVSSRVVADWFEASHAHVRKVRCAIAYGVVFYQRMFLLSLPMVAHLIWMASCDESEINLTPPSSGSSTKCNVLMMHFIVRQRQR